MAIYTIQIKTVSRSAGHSATAKIAYNCRDKITDLRTGEIHKYDSAKMSADLIHSEITHKDLTLDKKERSEIWNNAELAENRKDSRTAREYVVALPKELSTEQNIELVREFANGLTYKYNNVADWAIHNERDGNGNIHAHILTTTRMFDAETKCLRDKTDLELDNGRLKKEGKQVTQEQIKEIRKDWETIQNKHLEMAGLDLTVSCERKEDRETVKKHLGKEAVALERQGVETELGNYNRIIDNVVQLERQIYSDGNNLAQERAELERLELQKQELEQIRQLEEQHRQQREQARLQELARLELLRLEQIRLSEEKKQVELKALETQAEQAQVIKEQQAQQLTITTSSKFYLFEIAREQRQYFHREGDEWHSWNSGVVVKKDRVEVKTCTNNNLELALDVAVRKFDNQLVLTGGDKFITATIEILAREDKYLNVQIGSQEQQERLDQQRKLVADKRQLQERSQQEEQHGLAEAKRIGAAALDKLRQLQGERLEREQREQRELAGLEELRRIEEQVRVERQQQLVQEKLGAVEYEQTHRESEARRSDKTWYIKVEIDHRSQFVSFDNRMEWLKFFNDQAIEQKNEAVKTQISTMVINGEKMNQSKAREFCEVLGIGFKKAGKTEELQQELGMGMGMSR